MFAANRSEEINIFRSCFKVYISIVDMIVFVNISSNSSFLSEQIQLTITA